MSRVVQGKTSTSQLTRMRNKYLKDSVDKLKDFNDKIPALEAEVGPYVEKVRQLEKLYNCLRKEQKRYNKLLDLVK